MPAGDLDRVEIYRRRRQWRWTYVAAGNNKKLANGGEAYQDFEDCWTAMVRVLHIRRDPGTWTKVPSRDGVLQTFIATRYNGEQITVEVSHR